MTTAKEKTGGISAAAAEVGQQRQVLVNVATRTDLGRLKRLEEIDWSPAVKDHPWSAIKLVLNGQQVLRSVDAQVASLRKVSLNSPLDAPMFVKRLRGRRRVGPLPRFFGRGVGLGRV